MHNKKPLGEIHEDLASGSQSDDVKKDVELTYGSSLKEILGTNTEAAAEAILDNLTLSCAGPAAFNREHMLVFFAETKPSSTIEAMLIAQMTATHFAVSYTAGARNCAKTSQEMESYERSLTRLSRTFLSQIEALNRLQGRSENAVRVSNVNVGEGGQAVVGDVHISKT